MSFKKLFSQSLSANPSRLHFAAHSHHLWPDASFEGHIEAWEDASRLADRKWDKVMDEVWPEAQANVSRELASGKPDSIAFSSNTHDFIIRLFTAAPRTSGRLQILTSDGEFHSARRQLARWKEADWVEVERVATLPFESFSDRFLERALSGDHDLIFVSQVMFGSGRIFDRIEELAAHSRADGPWLVVDGYHAFMALSEPLGANAARSSFYFGGGYKYAMAGEGCAFLHAPEGFAPRPPVTGWFAEFEDLSLPPESVGYARDGRRFLGATFDPSGLYRFNAVQRMLRSNDLTTERISAHVLGLQKRFLEVVDQTPLGEAEQLNPLNGAPHARFLAFRSPAALRWHEELKAKNCITDVRGDVLRIGFAIYQDESDVGRLVDLLRELC